MTASLLDKTLVNAAKSGDVSAVRTALGAGANPDGADPAGNSALKWAALRGHAAALEALLAAGADPNLLDANGWTPLMATTMTGAVPTAALLIEGGADPNLGAPFTAYQLATERGQSAIIELLEQRGADTRLPLSDPAVPTAWLTRPIEASVGELERTHRYPVTEGWFLREHPELLEGSSLPFGHSHLDWLELRRQMLPDDELWEFSSIATGEYPGSSGIALVRGGHPLAAVELAQYHRAFVWRLDDLSFEERANRNDPHAGLGMFAYFKGPTSEMSQLSETPMECAFCGRVARGFSLAFAICRELCPEPYREAADRREGKHGCGDCLRAGRFEFWHDTEVGLLPEMGLEQHYADNQPAPADFRADAVSELRKTPLYRCCQQELWLAHCSDFMVYEGAWQPADFHHAAEDGDGRTLFLQVAGGQWAEWWEAGPDRVLAGYTPARWGDAGCYVFRCRRCEQRRAHFDWL